MGRWRGPRSRSQAVDNSHDAVTGGFGSRIEACARCKLTQLARRDIEDLLQKTGVKTEFMMESGDIDSVAGLRADAVVIRRASAQGVAGRLRSHVYTIIR